MEGHLRSKIYLYISIVTSQLLLGQNQFLIQMTRHVADRILNQRLIYNVEYCPQLAPAEKGYSLVWAYA